MKLFSFLVLILGIVAIFMTPNAACAEFSTIDISSFANLRLQDLQVIRPVASAYPDGPTVYAGVPFDRQSNGFDTWASSMGDYASPRSVDIPVGVFGVTTVYTLINTIWGQPGTYASISFFGSEGAFYELDLYGGQDIRDWLFSEYTNTINGTTTVNVFTAATGGIYDQARIDMQRIELPSAFSSQTLTNIVLLDTGMGSTYYDGPTFIEGPSGFQRIFLTGITVESVPEPSAYLLGALALLGLFAFRRSR